MAVAENVVAISIVVPVKDEAGNIGPLAREIAAAVGPLRQPYEMIFVDDGSTDATAAELLALRPELTQLRILKHERNLGQSRAVRTGVLAARGGLVVTLDGDGQNDPADIPRLLAPLGRSGGPAMVAGERQKRQDTWKKRTASKLANGFRRWMLEDKASDTGCGLKAFRRDAFLALPYFDHMHRYLITLMLREGHEVRFVPVGHRARGAGRSKYGVWDRFTVGITDVLGVLWLKRRFRGASEVKEL